MIKPILVSTFIAIAGGIGDFADYDLRKSRSSDVVQEGDLKLHIPDEGIDEYGKPAYNVNIYYNFKISYRRIKGERTVAVDKYFFTTEFRAYLRTHGNFSNPKFTAEYVRSEGSCDLVKFYYLGDTSPAEDLVLHVNLCDGYLVIGAQSIEATAKIRGQRVKIYMEYANGYFGPNIKSVPVGK